MVCSCEPWKMDRNRTSWRKVCNFLRDGRASIRYARAEAWMTHGEKWMVVGGGVGIRAPMDAEFPTLDQAQAAGNRWLRKVCGAEGGGFAGCGRGRRR